MHTLGEFDPNPHCFRQELWGKEDKENLRKNRRGIHGNWYLWICCDMSSGCRSRSRSICNVDTSLDGSSSVRCNVGSPLSYGCWLCHMTMWERKDRWPHLRLQDLTWECCKQRFPRGNLREHDLEAGRSKLLQVLQHRIYGQVTIVSPEGAPVLEKGATINKDVVMPAPGRIFCASCCSEDSAATDTGKQGIINAWAGRKKGKLCCGKPKGCCNLSSVLYRLGVGLLAKHVCIGRDYIIGYAVIRRESELLRKEGRSLQHVCQLNMQARQSVAGRDGERGTWSNVKAGTIIQRLCVIPSVNIKCSLQRKIQQVCSLSEVEISGRDE